MVKGGGRRKGKGKRHRGGRHRGGRHRGARHQIAKTTRGKGRHYLPISQGAGMTAAGRRADARLNHSHLKAPQHKGKRHDNFCKRSRSWKGPRGKAARDRWGCG